MSLSAVQRQEAADALWEAREAHQTIAPLTETYEGIDVDDAYEIQLVNVRRELAGGRRILGHKVGLSAKAMQQALGVPEPDYGHLLDDMFCFEGDAVPTGRLLQPRAEIEVAFVLGRPLRGPGVTVAGVLRATEFVLPSIEIVDSRIADWKLKIQDTVADNASCGMLVLGGHAVRPSDVDLRTIGAVLRKNGEVVETGAAGAVLGNPATAVAWLANKVAAFGTVLAAGDVILPGSCVRMVPVVSGDVIRADFDVLGSVSCSFG